MAKYRFKTKEEFIADGRWRSHEDPPRPISWNSDMLRFLGTDIPDKHNGHCDDSSSFYIDDVMCDTTWNIDRKDYILITTYKTNSGMEILPMKEFKM